MPALPVLPVLPVLRLGLVFALLWLPLATTWRSGASAAALAFDAAEAPAHIGAHRAVGDHPLDADVVDMLQPDSYVLRRYVSRSAPEIWLYLAAYSGLGGTGAHDPAVCYPANGWDLNALRQRDVALEEGGVLRVKLLRAEQGGRQELVLYWFQPVGRWPRGAPIEQLLRAYDGFSGRPQYVFVRLSTPLDADVQTGERALVAFARELAPWLRRAMESELEAVQSARPLPDSARVAAGIMPALRMDPAEWRVSKSGPRADARRVETTEDDPCQGVARCPGRSMRQHEPRSMGDGPGGPDEGRGIARASGGSWGERSA